jgi:hypothetical protein
VRRSSRWAWTPHHRPIEFQEKMQFLASARAVMRTIVSQAITAIVGIAAVGGATAIWMQMGQPK